MPGKRGWRALLRHLWRISRLNLRMAACRKGEGMIYHIKQVQDITGFAYADIAPKSHGWICCRDTVTSDQPIFYTMIESAFGVLFSGITLARENVLRFLAALHSDGSADLYVNDFELQLQCLAKRNLRAGESVMESDIADVPRMTLPSVKIAPSDNVICCVKIGWKYGMFFDLRRRTASSEDQNPDLIWLSLGRLYRILAFDYIYRTLETQAVFDALVRDGWFPFVEIATHGFKELVPAYTKGFGKKEKIDGLVALFDEARLEGMSSRWWRVPVFNEKRGLIEAGIEAFRRNTEQGNVQCIKTLVSEIEGVLRMDALIRTGTDPGSKPQRFTEYVKQQGLAKSGLADSLLLPEHFTKYLKDVFYPNFQLDGSPLAVTRHTASHGVADVNMYTRERALQVILTLDQIAFYIGGGKSGEAPSPVKE